MASTGRRISGQRGGPGEVVVPASKPGSSPTRYVVTLRHSPSQDGGLEFVCDPQCRGFAFRADCRHVQEAVLLLSYETPAVRVHVGEADRMKMARPESAGPEGDWTTGYPELTAASP